MSPTFDIPTVILTNPAIPAAALQTYLRLRLLAADQPETPPLPLCELARLCSRSRSALHAHLIILRAFAVLDWAFSVEHLWVISFRPSQEAAPSVTALPPPLPASDRPLSGIQDAGFQDALSLKPESINHNIDSAEERGEARILNPGSPAAIYHEITNLRPNKAQRVVLADQVDDLDRWRQTLTHWMSHRWNPKNLPGMLDLYRRGGPSACRYCDRGARPRLLLNPPICPPWRSSVESMLPNSPSATPAPAAPEPPTPLVPEPPAPPVPETPASALPSNPTFAVLEMLSLAYPRQPIPARTFHLYFEQLADIPPYLLEAAAELHVRSAVFFPSIAELRQAAHKVAGGQPFASLPPAPIDLLAARLQSLEDDFYFAGRLDPVEWRDLARRFDLADRPHRAADTLARLQRLADTV